MHFLMWAVLQLSPLEFSEVTTTSSPPPMGTMWLPLQVAKPATSHSQVLNSCRVFRCFFPTSAADRNRAQFCAEFPVSMLLFYCGSYRTQLWAGSILCFVMHKDRKGFSCPRELAVRSHNSPYHTVRHDDMFFLFHVSPAVGVTSSLCPNIRSAMKSWLLKGLLSWQVQVHGFPKALPQSHCQERGLS